MNRAVCLVISLITTNVSKAANVLTLGSWHQTFCARAMYCWAYDLFPGSAYWRIWCLTLNWAAKLCTGESMHCYNQLLAYPKLRPHLWWRVWNKVLRGSCNGLHRD